MPLRGSWACNRPSGADRRCYHSGCSGRFEASGPATLRPARRGQGCRGLQWPLRDSWSCNVTIAHFLHPLSLVAVAASRLLVLQLRRFFIVVGLCRLLQWPLRDSWSCNFELDQLLPGVEV